MVKIRRETEIPIASMSDIAFLLIIFFILSISFLYQQGLKLSLPKKGAPPVVVQVKDTIMLKLDKNGNLYKNNKKITIDKIDIRNEKTAIIKIDRGCKYKYLVYVIEELQKNNIFKISIKKL